MSRNEIEWDKTRDALAKLMKENYDKTRNLDLINTWYQARVLGDRLQEKQRETQFLLNCESAILRDCRQQLGDYMKKIEAKNEVVVHGGRFEDIEDEKLRNILLGPHTKKPEGET